MSLSVRVPGCQELQMTAYPGLARDALQLYRYGNWATVGVKGLTRLITQSDLSHVHCTQAQWTQRIAEQETALQCTMSD